MSRFWSTLAAVMLLGYTATAQENPSGSAKLPFFDEPVALRQFYGISAFRAWEDDDSFFLLPTQVQPDTDHFLTVHYEYDGRRYQGTATFNIFPAFQQQEFDAMIAELRQTGPDARFVVGEPVHSEWQVIGFGINETVTPVLASNPLLSATSVNVDLPDRLLRILLHENTHYADSFVVRHRFAIRGVELGRDFAPRVTTRWFNRGASFHGNCKLFPERYVNIHNGREGCVFPNQPAPADIVDAQAKLKELGYYKGPVDGVVGPLTRGAVRQFQRAAGMVEDGAITSLVLRGLEREAGSAEQVND